MAESSDSHAEPSGTAPSAVPENQVNLRLLLVSGAKADFLFPVAANVSHIKKHVAENWPPAWKDEPRQSAGALRILHQGRFLEDSVTLESVKVPAGQTTTMHLVPKPGVKEETSAPVPDKPKEAAAPPSSKCACNII